MLVCTEVGKRNIKYYNYLTPCPLPGGSSSQVKASCCCRCRPLSSAEYTSVLGFAVLAPVLRACVSPLPRPPAGVVCVCFDTVLSFLLQLLTLFPPQFSFYCSLSFFVSVYQVLSSLLSIHIIFVP